jgi:lipopolysaccharide export system permease protein
MPGLILAFLISLGTVWINDIAVTWGRLGMQRVVLHSLDKIIYGMLRTQRSYSSKQLSITVKAVEDRTLVRPMICFHQSGTKGPIVLTAQEAELRLKPQEGMMSIMLTNGEIDMGGGVRVRFPDTVERDVLLTAASRRGASSERPSCMPFWKIPDAIVKVQEEIAQQRQQSAVEAAYYMMSGDMAGLIAADWARKEGHLLGKQNHLHRLRTEPWRRWATGFSCLFFVMVGAPLAIRLRNADLWTSFAVCFLPILIVYYPLLAYGVDSAKSGDLPPYCVWLGNVILGLAGLWNIRKVLRY